MPDVKPGVSRTNRISDEGLQRLEKQLQAGVKMSPMIQGQWIKRYGEAADKLIRQYPETSHNNKLK